MLSSVSLLSSYRSGLYDCGVRVICIHGRTRGSTKHRRVGPADLVAIGKIAADLQIYHQSHQRESQIDSSMVWDHQMFVISNGNIISPADILRNIRIFQDVCQSTDSSHSPICGFMSAEGILKDPALFYRFQVLQESVNPTGTQAISTAPSLSELFAEYCKLSSLYSSVNGWEGFDLLEAKKFSSHPACSCDSPSCSSPSSSLTIHPLACANCSHETRIEDKNLSVARQHLNWMLGKSGHGRLIRYEYLAEAFKRHTDQMNEINGCKNVQELLQIAELAFFPQSLES
jgi:tRNA-dihydrouridine synthase